MANFVHEINVNRKITTMNKRNHFSQKFERKTSEELKSILNSEGYQQEAKLAAVWELEKRNEADVEDQELVNHIDEEIKNKEQVRLSEIRYQTILHRLIAAIVDGIILWPIGFLLAYLTISDITFIVLIGSILTNLYPYVYSVLLHGHNGQTLGKMIMGIKVVRFDNEGDIDLKQAFVRDSVPIVLVILHFGYSLTMIIGNELTGDEYIDMATAFVALTQAVIIGFLSSIWTIAELLSMLFNEKSRAIHDLIAKTVVIRVK